MTTAITTATKRAGTASAERACQSRTSAYATNRFATINQALMNLWFASTSTLSWTVNATRVKAANAISTRRSRQVTSANAKATRRSLGPNVKAR